MAKMLMLNPAPRKRRKVKRKSVAKRRASTRTIRVAAPRKVRRYRRNPIGGMKSSGLLKQSIDAFIGAGGAIGTDVIMKMLPLPAALQTGYARDLTRAAIAVGLGYVTEKGLKQRATGRKMTEGALTVIAHGMAMQAVGANLGLSGYQDWGTQIYPGLNTGIYPNVGTGLAAYQNVAPVSAGLGAYQDSFLQ
jgi:hypothetical protein